MKLYSTIFMVFTSAICSAGDDVQSAPDDEVLQQAKLLDLSQPEAKRLEAAKWLEKQYKQKNAYLAYSVLESSVRKDPSLKVREAAVNCLGLIAYHQKDPCPLCLLEAMLDPNEEICLAASTVASLFKQYPKGAVEVLLRCAGSDQKNTRSSCMMMLAMADGKDKRVLLALKQATKDSSVLVRHNAHVAKFHAKDDLEEFLTYLIQLQDDSGQVLGRPDKTTEQGKQDLATIDIARISSATIIADWMEARAEVLAKSLLDLLSSPNAVLRRGAIRLIAASYQKVDRGALHKTDQASTGKEGAKDGQAVVPSKAAIVLNKMKVIDRLNQLNDKDTNEDIRLAAQAAVARINQLQKKANLLRRHIKNSLL